MIYSRRTKAIATIKSERSIFSPVNSAAKTKIKNKTILIDRNIARAFSTFALPASFSPHKLRKSLFVYSQ